MASFAERFGVEVPIDPVERQRLIMALRFQNRIDPATPSENPPNARGFVPPPGADWDVNSSPPRAGGWTDQPTGRAARTDWEWETRRPPQDNIAGARNDAGNEDVAGARNEVPAAPRFAWKETTDGVGIAPPDPAKPTFAWKDPPAAAAPPPPKAEDDPIGPRAPAIPQSEALARGIRSGTTLGWGDEITAAQKASGLPSSNWERLLPSVVQAPLAAIRTGVGMARKAFGDQGAQDTYQQSVDQDRFRTDEARKQHPGTTLAGEVAGGLAVPLPGATTGRLGMVALKGAGYGGLTSGVSAAGESKDGIDPKSVGIGAGIGSTVGATLPYAGRLASWIAGRPINTARNLLFPQGGAERAVGQAAQEADQVAAREAAERLRRGLPPERQHRLTQAEMRAEPEAMMVDTLGQPGRDLARSATNLSSEAHATLGGALADRSARRSERGVEAIDQQFGPTPSAAIRERLIEEGSNTSDPLYRFAREQGNYDLSQTLSGGQGLPRLLERSPALRRAAQEAEASLQNRYAGRDEVWDGTRNLEYWDQVKRQLDQQITAATNRGQTADVDVLSSVKNALVERLDRQVPGYADARANSAEFFGSGRAVQAGERLYGRTQDIDQAVRTIQGLRPADRGLAGQGLMDRVRTAVSRDPNFWNKFERNTGSIRDKMQGVLTPQEFATMQARSHLERVMQSSREAVSGNSTTARQLALRGLATAGGAGIGYGGGEDYSDLGTLMSAAGLAQFARKGGDARVARRIGELLRSNDPAVLDRAAAAFARNQQVMHTLRLMTSGTRDVASRETSKAVARQREQR